MARRLALSAWIVVVALLMWQPAQAADPESAVIQPRDMTAHATHDTVHLTWDAGVSDLAYNVHLYKSYWNYSGFLRGPSREFVVGPDTPYELTIAELEPDTSYMVEIYQGDWRDRHSAVLHVHTEPVPEHWWEANIARGIATGVFGDRILVYWTCLGQPLIDELEVEIKEYGAPQSTVRTHSVACATNVLVSDPVQRGTTYEVAIQPTDMKHYQQKLVATIPSSVRESLTLESSIPRWDVSVEYSDDIRGWVFAVSVDDDDTTSLVEVEWNREGHRMTRVGAGPFVYYSDSPGPFPFRVRRVADQAASSRWSSSRLASVEPQPPWAAAIRYQQRGAELHIAWPPYGWHPSGLDGYRAYLVGEGAPPQVVDTGLSRTAVFELAPHLSQYVLLVGAYRNDLGLGELTRVDIDVARQPELLLQVDKYQPSCLLNSGSPMRGFWTVKHGVPPYRVTVGAQEPVTSVLPHGVFEAGCTADDGQWSDDDVLVAQVSVEAEDGLGRRMDGSLTYRVSGYGELGEAPVSATNGPRPVGLRVSDLIVGSTGFGVVVQERSLDALYWRREFVIRWRLSGQGDWNYERDSLEVALTRVTTIRLKGLMPNTSYEFQVTGDFPGIRAEEIPEEAWSRLQEVRTWPGGIRPHYSRVGTSVTVNWDAGPSEWGYSVVLRGDGESWWKAHVPSGTDMESVVFRGIPVDAAIEVEVITPPVGAPSWDGYRG